MKFTFQSRGRAHELDLQLGGDKIEAYIDGEHLSLSSLSKGPESLSFELGGQKHELHYAREGADIWLHFASQNYHLQRVAQAGGSRIGIGAGDGQMRSPMPGQVKQLFVLEGAEVERNEVLLVLEAMKMEMRLSAPTAGRVAQLNVAEGESVEKDQLLVEIEAEEAAP